ncbi:MAG: hypothetical protein AAGJ18_21325 [Bacteroidota bacterium]
MRLVVIVLLYAIPTFAFSQDLRLENASFEDEPQDATMPQRWHSCKKGSTPDILPGFWGVYLEPYDGDTYVGLITRPDGSYEVIGQKLVEPMKGMECYSFSMQLAHSRSYVNYNIPIRLRIYGGKEFCQKSQLLAESESIKNTDWETYKFEVFPKEDYNYLILEAYYAKGIYTPYPGNILIDDISVFKKCPRAEVITKKLGVNTF